MPDPIAARTIEISHHIPASLEQIAMVMQKLNILPTFAITHGLSRYEAQRVRTLSGLALMAIVASILSMPAMFIDRRPEAFPVNFVFQLSMACVLWLQRRGRHTAAASVFTVAAWLAVTGQTLYLGSATGIHFWYLPLVFLPAVIFPSRDNRINVVASATSLVSYAGCVLWVEATQQAGVLYVVAQILSAAAVFAMSIIMRRAMLNAQGESEHRRMLLEEQAANLRNSNVLLDHANRHKDEFLANISHELRTPLSAILGFNEILLRRIYGDLTARQVNALHQVEASGTQLLELIDSILTISQMQIEPVELAFSDVSIVQVCKEAVEATTPRAAKKGLAVQLEIEDQSIADIPADAAGIRQVLGNLLDNAIKFTERGEIGLVVSASDPEFVRIDVWDTGIGIPKEEFALLFEPFRQVDESQGRRYAGSGLGLALSKLLVEAHGGRIHVQSEVRRGSRFSVLLPTSSSTSVPSNAEDAVHAETTGA
ncbi:MAG: HAMP domain-containing sensor histidine kinase [Myxococcota bacterium]|nr:HAMP domain-containing sensor histidine kinase [Myxococcota bacterium]MEE2673748.1 HAMP domain-containing sensor histidine kinase [Myxococcota bacterium]